MLWKEFKEKNLECEECPLYINEYCAGGADCHGGIHREPPCCSLEDDTDLEQWCSECFEFRIKEEERIEKKIKLKEEKERINEERKLKRRKTEEYCYEENYKIRQLKKRIKKLTKINQFSKSFSSAINITNEMFGYKERVEPKTNLDIEIEQLEIELTEAKKAKKEKIKEWHNKLKEETKC
ncbi:MAG: hypothetical protein ACTSPI_08805 [Candidatus Heimdallarchaeaceae archaeon]